MLLVQWESPIPTFKQILSVAVEEFGLVSVICEWEGLVSAGFKMGRTGFGWFWLIPAGFRQFRVVPPFSNYPFSWLHLKQCTQHIYSVLL